jgi:SNF2 family DNA or RNA helicase
VKIKVGITPTQNGIYQQLKRDLATLLDSGDLVTIPNKISLFTKFRQIVGGTLKVDGEYQIIEPRPEKLVALLDDLEDTDEQAIIWCAFRGEVQMIMKALERLGTAVTFDGSTSIEQRNKDKLAFQSGQARFFVGNMKAGSFGLNLQNCALQYFYSRDTSPQVNWQAEDRSHRPGQTRTCVYKSLIVKDTVDERILQLIEESADLRDLLRGMGAADILNMI